MKIIRILHAVLYYYSNNFLRICSISNTVSCETKTPIFYFRKWFVQKTITEAYVACVLRQIK